MLVCGFLQPGRVSLKYISIKIAVLVSYKLHNYYLRMRGIIKEAGHDYYHLFQFSKEIIIVMSQIIFHLNYAIFF